MNPPEFFVIMTAMIGGLALGGFLIHRITELIRFRMERKHIRVSPEFDHITKQNQELVQWLKKAEKRLKVLEEIAAEEGDRRVLVGSKDPLLDTMVKDGESYNRSVPNQLRDRS